MKLRIATPKAKRYARILVYGAPATTRHMARFALTFPNPLVVDADGTIDDTVAPDNVPVLASSSRMEIRELIDIIRAGKISAGTLVLNTITRIQDEIANNNVQSGPRYYQETQRLVVELIEAAAALPLHLVLIAHDRPKFANPNDLVAGRLLEEKAVIGTMPDVVAGVPRTVDYVLEMLLNPDDTVTLQRTPFAHVIDPPTAAGVFGFLGIQAEPPAPAAPNVVEEIELPATGTHGSTSPRSAAATTTQSTRRPAASSAPTPTAATMPAATASAPAPAAPPALPATPKADEIVVPSATPPTAPAATAQPPAPTATATDSSEPPAATNADPVAPAPTLSAVPNVWPADLGDPLTLDPASKLYASVKHLQELARLENERRRTTGEPQLSLREHLTAWNLVGADSKITAKNARAAVRKFLEALVAPLDAANAPDSIEPGLPLPDANTWPEAHKRVLQLIGTLNRDPDAVHALIRKHGVELLKDVPLAKLPQLEADLIALPPVVATSSGEGAADVAPAAESPTPAAATPSQKRPQYGIPAALR